MSNILISTPPTSLATGLLQLDNGVAISSTPVYVADQNNTDSSLAISTNKVGIGTTNPTAKLQINESINSNVLKLVNSADTSQYFSMYLSSAPNLWDIGPLGDDGNTILRMYRNNYIVTRINSTEYMRQESGGIGLFTAGATPTARLQVKGSGSTSATTSFLVQNSAGTNAFYIRDDRNAWFGEYVTIGGSHSSYIDIGVNGSNFNEITARGNGLTISTASSFGANSNINITPQANWNISETVSGTGVIAWGSGGAERMRLLANGNFLIATTTDAGYKLAVNGDAQINTLRIGLGAGSIATNTVLGKLGLNANTTGNNNTAVGNNSLTTNTIGQNNTAIGSSTLQANSTGDNNVAIGRDSLIANTGSNNVGVGYQSLYTNTSATGLVAIGYQALQNNTGASNTAVGYSSSAGITSGTNNTSVGYQSLLQNTSGTYNVAIGMRSLYVSASGTNNTAIGSLNSALNSTGSNNVSVGYGTHYSNNTGSNNTLVGYNAQSTNFDSCVVLGRDAQSTASNQFVVGSASYNAGTVVAGANVSSQYWNVKINGVDYKILLA